MKRILIPIVTVILITMGVLSILQSGLTVKVDMPDVIQAGSEITVNVTISKGKLTGFARFQQDLPNGFTVKAVNSANADFNFEDHKLRLIWLNLPEQSDFTATYTLIADERLKGTIDIGGKFSYIDDNERKTLDVLPKSLAIKPSSKIDASLIVDVNDFDKSSQPLLAIAKTPEILKMGQVSALRQRPRWYQVNNAYLVVLLVNKNSVEKLAKLEETIPDGFKAESVDSKNAIFTFENNTAKFVWNVLPSEPYFTIKYKVVPQASTKVDPLTVVRIAGVFSYLDGDKTLLVDVIEQDQALEGLSADAVSEVVAKASSGSPSTDTVATTVAQPAETVPEQEVAKVVPVVVQESVQPESQAVSTPTIAKTSNPPAEIKKVSSQTGIYFRVQIAAGHKPVNATRYFGRYQLQYPVAREEHEGWYKYLVGPFDEYRSARDYRVHLRTETPLMDAFVTAYNNGQRITVQEALLSLNQQWVR
jgi:hypothetical protein